MEVDRWEGGAQLQMMFLLCVIQVHHHICTVSLQFQYGWDFMKRL